MELLFVLLKDISKKQCHTNQIKCLFFCNKLMTLKSKKIKFKVPDGYNCLVNPSGSEYVVFSFISCYVNQLLDLYCEYYSYETFPVNKI